MGTQTTFGRFTIYLVAASLAVAMLAAHEAATDPSLVLPAQVDVRR